MPRGIDHISEVDASDHRAARRRRDLDTERLPDLVEHGHGPGEEMPCREACRAGPGAARRGS